MQSELTQSQRLTALLALLDETIRLDEERTQGEWYQATYCVGERDTGHIANTYNDKAEDEGRGNASFIANASVTSGRNARALKEEILFWRPIAANSYDGNERWELANSRIRSIISMYPDSILIPYSKPVWRY